MCTEKILNFITENSKIFYRKKEYFQEILLLQRSQEFFSRFFCNYGKNWTLGIYKHFYNCGKVSK